MEQIVKYLKYAVVTLTAAASALWGYIKSPEFEHVIIAALILLPFLLLIDVSAVSKIVYSFILKSKKKGHGKDLGVSSLDESVEKKAKEISPDIKKLTKIKNLLSKLKDILARIVKFAIIPFSLGNFDRKRRTKIRLKLVKFEIKIPFFALWIAKIIFLNLCILSFLFIHLKKQFTSYPQYYAVFPREEEIWNDYSRPIEIEFDVPIDEKSLIINMAPETEGSWVFEKNFSFLPYTRRIKFYPKETIFPDQTIMIYLTDLTNHYHTMKGGEHLIQFKSISLPQIQAITPGENSVDVPIDQDLLINLNQKDGAYVDWEFKFDKEVNYEVVRDGSEIVKLSYLNTLRQGEAYTLEISQIPLSSNIETGEVSKRGDKVLVKTLAFTTVSAPLIESMEPTDGNVMPNVAIKVVFDNPMQKDTVESAFFITPETEGDKTWEDDRTFIFTPKQPLPKETHFEVIFTQGIKSQAGGISEQDITFSFDTIGKVRVVGWNPGYGAGNIRVGTSINVVFDQEVDHSSAQGKFSISPSVAGSFSWSGYTMIFKPSSSLAYSTKYTVTVAAGVKTVYGLDSNQNFSSSFTTEHNVFILDVPQYRQTHAFTCNVTAAAMALSYKGAASSEMGVYNGIAKDNTPCQKDGDTITYWGNPNSGFVGDINGGGECGGYGVYWSPIAGYINGRGRSAGIRNNWNVVALAQEIEQGNPVIIWWQNGWANPSWPPKNWNSPSGYVRGVNGMHSEVAVGFIGPSSSPTHIITNDPWRGRRTHTVGTFNSLWGRYALGGGSVRNAVVVY
ncbi:Ig-like domain-containing protein [Candidatus Dojkabacteria bacterium]|nr:Ig-like domain-containing protein [Candidatus Dojkabacteria bacterium]